MSNLLLGACPNGKVLEREGFSFRRRPSYYCIQDRTKQSNIFTSTCSGLQQHLTFCASLNPHLLLRSANVNRKDGLATASQMICAAMHSIPARYSTMFILGLTFFLIGKKDPLFDKCPPHLSNRPSRLSSISANGVLAASPTMANTSTCVLMAA